MSQALSPSFACRYGLARVARMWKVSRASVYRSVRETPPRPERPRLVRSARVRHGTGRSYPQANGCLRLHGEGYRKLWARLRFAGVRAEPQCATGGAGRTCRAASHWTHRGQAARWDDHHR